MTANIFSPSIAAAVPMKPCHGSHRADFERLAKHVMCVQRAISSTVPIVSQHCRSLASGGARALSVLTKSRNWDTQYTAKSHARSLWCDLSEHAEPFSDRAWIVSHHAREVAARVRQTCDEARADRIYDVGEHDWYCAGFLLQRGSGRSRHRKNDLWLHRDQFFRERLHLSACWREATFDMNIAALGPSTLFEFLLECFHLWVIAGSKHADKPEMLRLLRTRHCWARGRTESNKEIAPPH